MANNKRINSIISLSTLGAVLVGSAIITSQETHTSKKIQPNSSITSSNSTPPQSNGSNIQFKSGTYKATGNYFSPGGAESLAVTVSLENGIVTSSDVTSEADDPTAASYQASFIDGYKSSVVGKKINTINLVNVAGSSLTSQGFDNALKQIEKNAKA